MKIISVLSRIKMVIIFVGILICRCDIKKESLLNSFKNINEKFFPYISKACDVIYSDYAVKIIYPVIFFSILFSLVCTKLTKQKEVNLNVYIVSGVIRLLTLNPLTGLILICGSKKYYEKGRKKVDIELVPDPSYEKDETLNYPYVRCEYKTNDIRGIDFTLWSFLLSVVIIVILVWFLKPLYYSIGIAVIVVYWILMQKAVKLTHAKRYVKNGMSINDVRCVFKRFKLVDEGIDEEHNYVLMYRKSFFFSYRLVKFFFNDNKLVKTIVSK